MELTDPPAYRAVNIRKAHPGLYRSIMIVAVMSVALAANFLLSKPTFNPYGWHKAYIGTIFAVLGASQFVFLNMFRDLRKVRFVLAVSIAWMFFWGGSNAQQFFNGKASLQLPIMYFAVCFLQIPLLIEAPVNPMTRKR